MIGGGGLAKSMLVNEGMQTLDVWLKKKREEDGLGKSFTASLLAVRRRVLDLDILFLQFDGVRDRLQRAHRGGLGLAVQRPFWTSASARLDDAPMHDRREV